MDACGVGALPDADEYGDAGSNTLGHLSERVGGLNLPTLQRLGLGSIIPIEGVPPAADPVIHGRLHPLGPGKESTTGHWELMGVVPQHPLPTYPDGFPPEVVRAVAGATGLTFCGNKAADGVQIMCELGEHHLRTGEVILYTSADSVLQLAAHDDVLSEAELHEACARAREVVDVGRVIARPFTGPPDHFERTTGRKDFSLEPPGRSYLDELAAPVHAVGKVRDLFAGVGIDEAHTGKTNEQALAATTELVRGMGEGLCFTNLVETDQLYGHRHDTAGFHRALRAIDGAVAGWLDALGEDDLLVLTADHGVDPLSGHSDHTREQVPLLAWSPSLDGTRHDGLMADVGASVLRWLEGRAADPPLPGTPFVP
jgi:phosphopentomutase